MPDGASLDRTEAVSRRAAEIFAEEPAVKDYLALLDSQYKTIAGTLFIALKDFAEREGEALSAFAVFDHTLLKLRAIEEGIIVPLNPPAIPGLGKQGGFEHWIQSRGQGGVAELAEATRVFIRLGPRTATGRGGQELRSGARCNAARRARYLARDAWC